MEMMNMMKFGFWWVMMKVDDDGLVIGRRKDEDFW
jgi:hypothetical protein